MDAATNLHLEKTKSLANLVSLLAAAVLQLRQEVLAQLTGANVEVRIAAAGVHARNPSFDVTPARLIRSIVTERGVVHPVAEDTLAALGPV